MIRTLSPADDQWLNRGVQLLQIDGVFILEKVLDAQMCEHLTEAAVDVRDLITREIGAQRLRAAGESGIVRSPMKYRSEFYELLEVPPVSALVSKFLSPTAICHLMNAILLEPTDVSIGAATPLFQSSFHRDFPRFTGGVPLSLNSFFCLCNFAESNGSTRFVIGSHQSASQTVDAHEGRIVSVEAAVGSIIFFDSTIWHAGGVNTVPTVRAGVNVQWTHHWIKQQVDLVRFIGDDECTRLSPSIRQRLGYDSRVVTSLREYYVPEQQRSYKGGQG